MPKQNLTIIDAGIANIHVQIVDNSDVKSFLIPNNDEIKKLFRKNGLLEKLRSKDTELYITGKLADIVKDTLGHGAIVIPGAALWSQAKSLISKLPQAKSLGIIDLSASGYMIIAIDRDGNLKKDLLVTNPRCGAGTGINLSRILEKLDIKDDEVDKILASYLGEAGKKKRSEVTIRADRCGVFSSSATISDKNQGIPLDVALAVTMKSEVLKACKKMLPKTDVVYLSGRVFDWQFIRDCTEDYLRSIGVNQVIYDQSQSMLIDGVKFLVNKIGSDKFRPSEKKKLRWEEKLISYPSFADLKSKYEASNQFKRLPDPAIAEKEEALATRPVNIGLDVGSTMAKMIVADAKTEELLFKSSYDNHGDTIETIKYIWKDLKAQGIESLNIQHIGITGSGRYQVQKVLQKVYPQLGERIFVLVENYAHARGSIQNAKDHIRELKNKHPAINKDFCVLVDIGGEDTKVSVISLAREELFDNVMNIKCSAGTGSLMDTLKALFGIKEINEACRRAYEAPRAFEINATCAVFLMENAKKMQALGYSKDDILASCNYAIVENMARTLWDQIDFPENALVLLHGQTMLSDPLPLAVTHRIQEESKMYCLVPPLPGHRACLGLIESIKDKTIIQSSCPLDDLLDLDFQKKITVCRGAACGDKEACCSRTVLKSTDAIKKLTVSLGGCSAINELTGPSKKDDKAPDAYNEIWKFIDSAMPKSKSENRLIIPRSFAVSENAYWLSQIFAKLDIPVEVDSVQEDDILEAQPSFNIDVCAPVIGATGQFLRLARSPHGLILVPQIDFLPTGEKSVGKTCTSNQGGMAIAKNLSQLKYPDAKYFMFDLSLKSDDTDYITNLLWQKLQPVFKKYNKKVSKEDFREAAVYAAKQNKKLEAKVDDLVAQYLQTAVREHRNVAVVCGREYILNPGIYDSHVGKLLRDKGVVAIPSYALTAELDEQFGYVYWRNPHDIMSKVKAVTDKRLHELLLGSEVKEIVRRIEKGLTSTELSTVMVSTFRCGADTVTLPTIMEMTKTSPSLLIQSDAMIKELAHLENRVNTYINQLNKKLHKEFKQEKFELGMLDGFEFEELNKETDVVYFPTMHDNRMLTAVLRGAGFTVIDNYGSDETYDLEHKVRLGRKYAGDAVCAPLASVFADIVLAAEDFMERQKNNDKLVQGKKRVLVFDNKGSGPCRQGQYYEIHKLLLGRKFGFGGQSGKTDGMQFPLKLLVAHERAGYNFGVAEWALIQGFHSIIIQAVLHSLFLKGGASCQGAAEFAKFNRDYQQLKNDINHHFQYNVKPSAKVLKRAQRIDKRSKAIGWLYKFFAYGIYNNNGLRKLLKDFSSQWVKDSGGDHNKIKIHIEGEVYIRVAQVQQIFYSVVDSIGFDAFKIDYSPLWAYFELILNYAIFDLRADVKLAREALDSTTDKAKRAELKKEIRKKRYLPFLIRIGINGIRGLLIKPLYRAAKLEMPHPMKHVLAKTAKLIPTLKPRGELQPYVGEAIVKIEEGTDLFLNAAPEGCMVASMGQMFTKPVNKLTGKSARIQDLFSLNGEVDDEQLRLSLLKTMGPVRYYRKMV
ncbi:acyl-CoA dehydratase activase-related protein [Patescibacteria group bacterium]